MSIVTMVTLSMVVTVVTVLMGAVSMVSTCMYLLIDLLCLGYLLITMISIMSMVMVDTYLYNSAPIMYLSKVSYGTYVSTLWLGCLWCL